jgi:hypothetical protein
VLQRWSIVPHSSWFSTVAIANRGFPLFHLLVFVECELSPHSLLRSDKISFDLYLYLTVISWLKWNTHIVRRHTSSFLSSYSSISEVVDDSSDQCASYTDISIWQMNMCSNENMCCLSLAQHFTI